MDAKTDVSVSDLQNRIRIRISEFHADTNVKADTIRISRRYFSLPRSRPPCSRTRAATAALFAVSRAESPPSRRARAKIRPCAPLLTHHPAIPIQSFYSPVLKFPISTLAARPLPGRRRRRPSAPLQVLLAPLLRAGDLCSVLVCSQVCLPVAATVGRGFTPTVTLSLLLRRSRARRQFDSRSRQAWLKAYRALVAPPPAAPSDLLLNQQR